RDLHQRRQPAAVRDRRCAGRDGRGRQIHHAAVGAELHHADHHQSALHARASRQRVHRRGERRVGHPGQRQPRPERGGSHHAQANLVRSSGTEGTSAEGIVRGALRYSPLPNEAYDTSRLAIDPRAENLALSGILGANPLRYADEVHESETVTRGLGGLRMFAQVLPWLSFETSLGGNYERKGVDSYFPRTVFEGRNTDGLAIVSGSEYVNLVHEDLVRFDRELGSDHHVDAVAGFTYD